MTETKMIRGSWKKDTHQGWYLNNVSPKIRALKSKSESGSIKNRSPLWERSRMALIRGSKYWKNTCRGWYLNNVSPKIHALKSKSESEPIENRSPLWKRSKWKWFWFEDREKKNTTPEQCHKIHVLKSKSESGPIENRSTPWKRSKRKWLWFEERKILTEAGTWTRTKQRITRNSRFKI